MSVTKDDGTIIGGPPRKGLRVAIDPGHGGTNVGCQYPGLSEKAYVLEFGLMLSDCLAARGFSTCVTRGKDVAQTFTQRAEVAEAFGADIAISLHVNANPSERARGLECYYMPDDILAHRLATCLYNAAPTKMKPWIKPAVRAASLDGKGDDAVLQRYDMPAVLVELGFASNAEDRAYLNSEQGKEHLIAGIAAGIEKYLAELPRE